MNAVVSLGPDVAERARKNEQIVLQRLASVGQKLVADAVGVSESTISRRAGGDFAELSKILAALGLKVVPVGMKCYRPEDIQPYLDLARQHLERVTHVDQLTWDD